jgi:mono/diheme cytochrome c family protein
MIMKNFCFLLPLLSILMVGCNSRKFKESKIFAGGQEVSATTLNLGHDTYLEYCVQCHGFKGEGNGPASKGMYPPPRNLTQGIYKFANVVGGELPHDEDFYRIIKHGLNGSAMLPWDIDGKRLEAVVHYIKTFAPQVWEGGDKTLGTKFEIPKDPFGDTYRHIAIEKGKKVYHITAACTQCHRGYESKENISKFNQEINKAPLLAQDFSADLYQVKPQDGDYNYKVVPPDFTYHPLRSIKDVESIVVRLMYGVNGSGMPGWKDVVTDEELWALAYYVDHLRGFKDDMSKRDSLLSGLGK